MLFLTIIAISESQRVLYEPDCHYQLSQLNTGEDAFGLPFDRPLYEEVEQQNTADRFTVSFRYHDPYALGIFFNDNNKSCLKSKLIRTDIGYNKIEELSFPITSSYENQYRKWTFTLTPSQFDSILYKSIFDGNITYYGFFAYEYLHSGYINEGLVTIGWLYFQVQFQPKIYDNETIKVNKSLFSYYWPDTYGERHFFKPEIRLMKHQLSFTDSMSADSCNSSKLNTTIYLGQQLFICYNIIKAYNESDHQSSIYFIGTNLIHESKIINVNSSDYYMLYYIEVDFLHNDLTLVVNNRHRRQATSANYSIKCIFMSSDTNECPREEQIANFKPKQQIQQKQVVSSIENYYENFIIIGLIIWVLIIIKLAIQYSDSTVINQASNQRGFDQISLEEIETVI